MVLPQTLESRPHKVPDPGHGAIEGSCRCIAFMLSRHIIRHALNIGPARTRPYAIMGPGHHSYRYHVCASSRTRGATASRDGVRSDATERYVLSSFHVRGMRHTNMYPTQKTYPSYPSRWATRRIRRGAWSSMHGNIPHGARCRRTPSLQITRSSWRRSCLPSYETWPPTKHTSGTSSQTSNRLLQRHPKP